MKPGLCSIAFRGLQPAEVAALAARAKLSGVEWGGDVHVPVGQLDRARDVARVTADAGLAVAAYGSYYKLGAPEAADPATFARVLETALALGAPTVRVWVGTEDAERVSQAARQVIVEQMLRDCDRAHAVGLTVSCEWHMGTLLSTNASARDFATEAAHPALRFYWQPNHYQDLSYCEAGLEVAAPLLSNVHVFHWWPSLHERKPLSEGASRWPRYLGAANKASPEGYALLEFVRGDTVAQLLEDAAVLRSWLPGLAK